MFRPYRSIRGGSVPCSHDNRTALRQRPTPGRSALRCQDLVELVTDYLEDTLDEAARQRLDVHLAHCPPCRAYLEQVRATVAAITREDNEPFDALRSRLLAAFSDRD